MAMNSPIGPAIHAPAIPMIFGNVSSPTTINKNVLKNDIVADTAPFENAVNNADENMLIPVNKNPKQ